MRLQPSAWIVLLWFFQVLGWAELLFQRPLSAGILFLVASFCGIGYFVTTVKKS